MGPEIWQSILASKDHEKVSFVRVVSSPAVLIFDEVESGNYEEVLP
jgi:hypothetical protein